MWRKSLLRLLLELAAYSFSRLRVKLSLQRNPLINKRASERSTRSPKAEKEPSLSQQSSDSLFPVRPGQGTNHLGD